MSAPRRKTHSKKTTSRRAGGRTPSDHKSSDRGFSHIDHRGRVRMVDVGGKPMTRRTAVARGRITLTPRVLHLIEEGSVAKGDPLQAARVAGIMAAKRTAELIPLCHSIPLTSVEVDFEQRADGYDIEACVKTTAQTGVEMEALTAVSTAALTIYDMVKAVDRTMVIGEVRLVEKSGGQSGSFRQG